MQGIKIPVWLVALCVLVFIAVILEQMYISKTPVDIWGLKLGKNNESQIPKFTIFAFNSDKCPSNGWEVFKQAEGRFLRGINTSQKANDINYRPPGSTQEYATASPTNDITVSSNGTHSHRVIVKTVTDRNNGEYGITMAQGTEISEPSIHTSSKGGHVHTMSGWDNETRPNNVAVIFCQKI